jgi:hypothetical protein
VAELSQNPGQQLLEVSGVPHGYIGPVRRCE